MRRDEGRSIKEIARLLGVSTSSVSRWVRDIELTAPQHDSLQARNGLHERQRLARAAMSEKARRLRREAQEAGRRWAREGDSLYIAGCMLYWAEGSRNRNRVVFTNSDPEMVKIFVTFLRRAFGLCPDRVRLTCNLFADHEARQHEIEEFWLHTAGLPRASLCKSTVNHYSRYSQKKRKNKLPFGTCRIVVNSTEIAQTIYGSIQELAGFDRPEWLDMPP
jgi:transcriptional regulator with XRE-family HTH domain